MVMVTDTLIMVIHTTDTGTLIMAVAIGLVIIMDITMVIMPVREDITQIMVMVATTVTREAIMDIAAQTVVVAIMVEELQEVVKDLQAHQDDHQVQQTLFQMHHEVLLEQQQLLEQIRLVSQTNRHVVQMLVATLQTDQVLHVHLKFLAQRLQLLHIIRDQERTLNMRAHMLSHVNIHHQTDHLIKEDTLAVLHQADRRA